LGLDERQNRLHRDRCIRRAAATWLRSDRGATRQICNRTRTERICGASDVLRQVLIAGVMAVRKPRSERISPSRLLNSPPRRAEDAMTRW
jgi:hypothetical protein